MEVFLNWLSNYSAPVVLMLVSGAVILYVSQHVVKKAVESEFEKRNSKFEILSNRRSNFEARILLDQYTIIKKLNHELASIAADVNRARSGNVIEGLYQGSELVPLTDVFIELQANKYLLRDTTHALLDDQAKSVLELANSKTTEDYQSITQKIVSNDEKMRKEMNDIFGIEKISWAELGTISTI